MRNQGLEKELDRLWQQAIVQRAKGRCEVCGSTWGLGGHHLVKRMLKRFRWDLDNGIALCAKCHNIAEDQKGLFMAWLMLNNRDRYNMSVLNNDQKNERFAVTEEFLRERKTALKQMLKGDQL